MAKVTKNNPRLVLAFLLCAAGILLFLQVLNGFQKNKDQEQVSSQENIETYTSHLLNFSVQVPQKFTIEEDYTSVLLKVENELIEINRTGTNFQNINSYLEDLIAMNNIKIDEKKQLRINDLETVTGKVIRLSMPDESNLSYFIYKDYQVYSLSTFSKDLFDELDQIARSFRYTP